MHSTTIVAIKKDGQIALGSDGQVTLGNTIIKGNAAKVRHLGKERAVLGGFAGSTADAFTLFEKFEAKLEENSQQLVKSAVELAKEWRMSENLRRLEAMLIVADSDKILTISGNGDVLEPEHEVTAIGSGAPYALASARSLHTHSSLSAEQIAHEALTIAADICIYTNHHFTIHTLSQKG